MARAHGGHNGTMHSGKHHPAGHKRKMLTAKAVVTTRGKRSSKRSLNPSSMKKPRGA